MTTSLPFWMCGVNNDTSINILDRVESLIAQNVVDNDQHQECLRKESIITKNSIILTELEDYRYKYLRLCLSGVFNDCKITILNEWSKQWYQYQHSWQSEVTHILKSIILTESEDYKHEYLRLWMSDVFNDLKFTSLNKLSHFAPERSRSFSIYWRSIIF